MIFYVVELAKKITKLDSKRKINPTFDITRLLVRTFTKTYRHFDDVKSNKIGVVQKVCKPFTQSRIMLDLPREL